MAAKVDALGGMLEETRRALAVLCVEDLEALAERAQRMLDEAGEWGAKPQKPIELLPEERAKLMREHLLLGDLLVATDENLGVLRRLEGRLRTDEVNSRWAL